MKKTFVNVLLLSFLLGVVSCGTNVPQESQVDRITGNQEAEVTKGAEVSNTPEPDAAVLPAVNMPEGFSYEKVKEAFLEYLNFKAWCNPSEMPQEAYECTFEVYRKAKAEGIKDIASTIGFRCLTANGVKWYSCTPVKGNSPFDWTKWTGEFVFGESSYQQEVLQYLGKDTISVPAVTKPEFTGEKETVLEELKRQAVYIYHNYLEELGRFRKNGEALKIELIVSDFSSAKGLKPYVYLIINDKDIFEEQIHLPDEFARDFFYGNYNRDPYHPYWEYEEFLGQALYSPDWIDRDRLERIKEIAVLDYVYEGEDSVETVPGNTPEQGVDPEQAVADLLPAGLPSGYDYEKVKEALLEYLNFEAWCNPSGVQQTAYECTYEVYREAKGEEMKEISGAVWFRCQDADDEKWYQCVPAGGELPSDLSKWTGTFYCREAAGPCYGVQRAGKDTVFIPVVTKPEFSGEKGMSLERAKHQAAEISYYLAGEEQFKKLYGEVFKMELIISDYSTQKNLSPYICLIINDKAVYLQRQKPDAFATLAKDFFYQNHNQDPEHPVFKFLEFHGDALSSFDSIDRKQLERIREIAVLDYVYLPATDAPTNPVTGSPTTIPTVVPTTLPTVIPTAVQEVTGGEVWETKEGNGSLVVGTSYAAYLDEEGKLHILYDTAGVTEGVDLEKKYSGLGVDRSCLVTIDEEGKAWASYPETPEEVEKTLYESIKEAVEAGGNWGCSNRDPDMMRSLAGLSGIRQLICYYRFDYNAVLEDGTVVSRMRNREQHTYKELQGAKQIATSIAGGMAGIKEDGTFVFTPMYDLIRQRKLEKWPKLKQLCGGSYFAGLKEDGTVIAEDPELDYLINTIEKWSDITRLAAASDTIAGLKADGTVVAVCTSGNDRGQCAVREWRDIVAVDTNGRVTVGVRKDGSFVTTEETELHNEN